MLLLLQKRDIIIVLFERCWWPQLQLFVAISPGLPVTYQQFRRI